MVFDTFKIDLRIDENLLVPCNNRLMSSPMIGREMLSCPYLRTIRDLTKFDSFLNKLVPVVRVSVLVDFLAGGDPIAPVLRFNRRVLGGMAFEDDGFFLLLGFVSAGPSREKPSVAISIVISGDRNGVLGLSMLPTSSIVAAESSRGRNLDSISSLLVFSMHLSVTARSPMRLICDEVVFTLLAGLRLSALYSRAVRAIRPPSCLGESLASCLKAQEVVLLVESVPRIGAWSVGCTLL